MNASSDNGTVTIDYSILENGHRVEGYFPIGEIFHTQWGQRKVVRHEREVIDIRPTEPFGV